MVSCVFSLVVMWSSLFLVSGTVLELKLAASYNPTSNTPKCVAVNTAAAGDPTQVHTCNFGLAATQNVAQAISFTDLHKKKRQKPTKKKTFSQQKQFQFFKKDTVLQTCKMLQR